MSDLAEFLLARFAEDPRLDAEWREALRGVIAWDARQPVNRGVLEIMAQVYREHPDYDPAEFDDRG